MNLAFFQQIISTNEHLYLATTYVNLQKGIDQIAMNISYD